MKINKHDLYRIRNISNYCECNQETGIATVKMHYDSVEEIIDKTRSRPDNPVLEGSVLSYLAEILEDVPEQFDVSFSISVDDYGDYDPDTLIGAYKNAFNELHYKKNEYSESANVRWILLLIIGILLVGIKEIGGKYEWFGTTGLVSTEIIFWAIAMFSEIFFEESVIFYTIGKVDDSVSGRVFKRISSIILCNSGGKELSCMDTKGFFRKHLRISVGYALSKNYILFFGPLFLFMFIVQATESLLKVNIFSPALLILYAVSGVSVILVLIGNLKFYQNKKPLSDFSLPVSVILLILLIAILFITLSLTEITSVMWVISIMNLVGMAVNILCIILQKKIIK